MAETCVAPSQDMPMCERKDVLDKLQEMVNDLEKTQKSIKQVPRVLIRSDVCECRKAKRGRYEEIQKERARGKMPPQFFDFPQRSDGANGCSTDGCSRPREEVKETGLSKDGGAGVKEGSCEPNKSGGEKENKEGNADQKKSGGEKEKMEEGNAEQKKCPAEDESKANEEKEKSCYRQKSDKKVKKPVCDEPPLPEERKINGPHPLIPVPKPQSFELRGSKMLIGCDCLRRNGMQHDCQRTLCQGKRECLKFPAPVCQPSGLAPPIIIPSPIITVDEPDCGPKKPKEKTKTQIEQRKILLNYARAQFQDKPPRPLGKQLPCRHHKKGKYYIRPVRRVAHTQTESTEKS